MNTNKVSLTIRLDPKLHAYVKQQAPDNRSAFLEELVRQHSLDNIQDDVVARIKRAMINDPSFIAAISSKLETSQADTRSVIDSIDYI